MQKKRLRPIVIALGLAGFTGSSLAVGFGNASSAAVLGQALDHVVGLRLDPGESLTAECVAAEVTVGDQRLPSAAIRVRLEGEGSNPQVRVQTLMPVDEPVVSVQVVVGCSSRLSRRFTLFADPAPAAQPSAPLPPPQALEPTVAEPRQAAPAASAPPAQAAAAEPRPAPQAPVVRRATADETRTARARTPAAPRSEAATEPVRTAAPRARLRLDPAEDPSRQAQAAAEAIEAAASAAATLAAAQATAGATSAAADRIATLEKQIEKLRADSAADREALKLLRQRAAESNAASNWIPWLAALIGALTLLVLWQALRLRRLQAEREQVWWNAMPPADGAAGPATAAGPGAAAAVATVAAVPAASAGAPSTGGYSTTRPGALGPVFSPDPAPGEPITEPPPLAGERTQVLPVGWRDEAEPQRDVSIEELIDLEQQAEFFIVLGQDEAAIDLLVDHLRSTGGGSPLPYLKLLEIYRRRGDREAYERTRARFNHRFNAYAPDWETDATDGRSLEDYPHIIARLQMAWPSPIDAMAELESLLFRKSRGELFDMPAYRDVLFLYSLARDLLDREPVDSGNVDVLLPINEGAEFTQPMSLDSGPGGLDSGIVPLDAQPTVPIDLDVTQPGIPASLFGETATDPGLGGPRRRS